MAIKRRRRWFRTAATAVLGLVALYLLAAYLFLPFVWELYEGDLNREPSEMVTHTQQGIPGDPINVGLIGLHGDILNAMAAAGWHPADPVTLRSSIEIGISVVLDRPYARAPVSTLLFEGRPQDLAFEKAAGESADRRHHVRFWQASSRLGSSLWLGAASFDRGVGISHDTGQITHHIGPDVDAERDLLIADLEKACALLSTQRIAGVGATRKGRNGGGDPYFTDGTATVGLLVPAFREGLPCLAGTK